jgi:hypothetical protein
VRELIFVKPTPEAFAETIDSLIKDRGADSFSLYDKGGVLSQICTPLAERHGVKVDVPVREATVHLVWADSGAELTQRLAEFLMVEDGVVVAPITDHFSRNRCVFPISPPKAGTHLLTTLLEVFGFAPGHTCPPFPRPGYWYYLEYTNAHTKAKDFFVDSVRRSLHGNRDHPFGKNPSVMIYRNPLDILVSEARYYHQDGKTLFCGYLDHLSEEERLLRLTDDPWLLGSIMERAADYVAWLDFPSVIPVSFEELIGQRGGGDDKEQEDVVWSLQLKLHVQGRPDEYCQKIFDPDSPTFNKGRLGAHREVFTERVWEKVRALPQDVMREFGYDKSNIMPDRRKEFRLRVPAFIEEDFASTELLVQRDFFGYNLVKVGGEYVAKPARGSYEENEVLRALDLEMLRHRVARLAESVESNH